MKRRIKDIVKYCAVTLNVIIALAMVVTAYCGMLPPQEYPKLSVLPLLFPYFLAASLFFLMAWLFIKWKMAFISLAAMILCATDIRGYFPINIPSEAPQSAFKIMSYNIGGVTKQKKDSLIEFMLENAPDIICFQECGKSLDLPNDERVAKAYPYNNINGKEGRNVCLSKFPILSSENIKYESHGNASTAHRILIGYDTLLVINNHLQSYLLAKTDIQEYKDITGKSTSMSDREKNTKDVVRKIMIGNKQRGPQAEIVLDYIQKHWERLTIACGDFNENTTGYAHYLFTKELNDAYTRTANGFGFTYSRNKIHYRIDHILCSDAFKPYDCHVVSSCNLSDHFPIICYLDRQ